MKKVMFGALFALVSMIVQASSMKDVESSTVINGSIVVATDGTVQTAVIDEADKYGQAIADMVRKAALQWRFQPVLRDGKPVVAKASMHVRVVLRKTDDGKYNARIKGATFGDRDPHSTDILQNAEGNRRLLPGYPGVAARYHVQGTVYLSLRVDRSGHVVEAVAEQVNLGNVGPERIAMRYRKVLAEAALTAARQWTYVIPTTGKLAKEDSWTARVPVNFSLGGHSAESRPVWQTYVPGPYTPAPWIDKPDTNAADAIADGVMQTDGAGPTLLFGPNRG
jgi:hypothetical protein